MQNARRWLPLVGFPRDGHKCKFLTLKGLSTTFEGSSATFKGLLNIVTIDVNA